MAEFLQSLIVNQKSSILEPMEEVMGKMKDSQPGSELRKRAEEKLKEKTGDSEDFSAMSPEKIAALIHELQVHQIELEMQNDELRRIQEALEKTRDKYSHLYDFAQIGYFTIDEGGVIEEANLTGAGMVGTERIALIGMPFTRLVLRDDQDLFYKHRQHLLETGISQSCELRLVKKDGPAFHAHMECMILKNRDGSIGRIRIAAGDITNLKQAEEVLKINLIKYQTLFQSLPIGITVSDKAGNILESNKEAERLLGLAKEEHAKRKIDGQEWRLIRPDGSPLPADEYASVRALKENRLVENVEMGIVRKDGNITWINVNAVPIPLEGYGVAIAYSDITGRRRMEGELLRVKKIESLGIVAGGIAHDFNNILTAILGNVALAKFQLTPEDEIFNLLSEAEKASIQAQSLTRQLLTFAKGGAPLKETASIRDILTESSLFVLRGSNCDCEFSIAEDLWLAEIDVGQISQVINNVVINANQAMPEGGTIGIAAENLVVDDKCNLLLKPGRYIRISITDRGVGIAEKHLSNIFDPYFTTKHAGSGLGLATSYSIIKRHNGHITVESRLGVGTTFHIYLPASDKAVPEKEDAQLIKGQGSILVMDDEASLRKTVGRMLEKLGYEPEFAAGGNEAIGMYKAALAAGKPYDAVIMDLTIPGGMGGKEAIKILREIAPDVNAIVSSGYSEDPVLANFREYGFKGMLPKPFNPAVLSKVLDEVIGGEGI